MELGNGNQVSDLHVFDAQTHIMNYSLGNIKTMSIKCAIELDIPDIIHQHGRPMKFSELVEALPINKSKAQGVYRLMRFLIHSGFFVTKKIGSQEDDDEGYLLAPASHFLLKNEPLSLRPLLELSVHPISAKPLECLSKWFKNDDATAFETAYGETVWNVLGRDHNLRRVFQEGMASDTQFVSAAVIKECKEVFEGVKTLVDVGGGTGYMMKAVADAFPDMRCICFDLPHVIAGLEDTNNMTYVAGDMFQAIPPADAVLLKWILHDWNDEECVRILKLCKEAIPSKEKGGKVIIIDMVVGDLKGIDEKNIEAKLLYDIGMMTSTTGMEREEKNWAKLFVDAGFSEYDIAHKLGQKSLIQLYH